ncbi:hypothetical protein [Pelagovum pacificum]|uniref:Uncharacterized protein n=1 Tax=Pelagovum pacificum TaxID=2588711 RepID=A0A5C5GI52_9RHOB|nr:hypothetical protein [Pelagovum pacificum]QQA43312.1 hypothetical protein I8N54_01700 [Pelagovum pacificum]TNY33551.1 hypothetical protein FHY64_09825 [Pelagovum pacificum]
MTALTQYARLESTGLWRPDPDSQRRDVIVAFGDATLVISDSQGRALTHWSLPAIERLNGHETPALYGPDLEGLETLEVAEPDMIAALDKIRRTIARSRPRPGRLRLFGVGLSIASVVALGVFWLPGAMVTQTLAVVPPAKRTEIGAMVLGHMQRITGPSCRSPTATEALARLKSRVLGADSNAQIVVLPSDELRSIYLPGGIIAVGRGLIENEEDPAVLAGYLLSAMAQVRVRDPLEGVLTDAGLGTTFRLFTTGEFPAENLAGPSQALLAAPPPTPPADVLLPYFEEAEVPVAPFARALSEDGGDVTGLVSAETAAEGAPVLRDADWVGLQQICGP